MRVVRESLRVSSQFEFFTWLRGEIQHFLPHEILIAGWGDFAGGRIHYDIVSLQQVETKRSADGNIHALLQQLHKRWISYYRMPFCINGSESLPAFRASDGLNALPALRGMNSTLVHGVRDERNRLDCLYITMHPNHETAADSRTMLEMLLPYIDSALRRITPLPGEDKEEQRPARETTCVGALSSRESEILNWVCEGKTNQEIGLILGISGYTVKSHLQRIFRKLDVYNRAQAVGKLAAARQFSTR